MASSLLDQCVGAIASEINGLALTNLATAQIYQRKLPTDRGLTLPCVVVSYPPGGGEQILPGTNTTEDIGYPVAVTILAADAGNQDLAIDTESDQYALWRETIILHFLNQRLTGVSEIYVCRIEPGTIMDPADFFERNVYAGGFIVRCIARQART